MVAGVPDGTVSINNYINRKLIFSRIMKFFSTSFPHTLAANSHFHTITNFYF